jgi:hypothetical protein
MTPDVIQESQEFRQFEILMDMMHQARDEMTDEHRLSTLGVLLGVVRFSESGTFPESLRLIGYDVKHEHRATTMFASAGLKNVQEEEIEAGDLNHTNSHLPSIPLPKHCRTIIAAMFAII